jgi:hypothetical protein
VGATLTTTGSFNLIDTANIQTIGTRMLVKDEGNAVFNGVYTWANATTIVRATDADTYGAGSPTQLGINDYFFVQSGNVNAGAAYIVNAPSGTITFGTSNITFAEFSKAQIYSANTSAGISLNGTVINALVDNVTTAFSTGNIVVKTSAQLTTPNIGDATGTSLSVTGNITGGNILGGANVNATTHTGTTVSVSANITGGNLLTGGLISATGNITGGNILGGANVNATTHTGTTVSVTANIAGGNLLTGGLISATGAITGAAITGSSLTVSTGNITGGNLILSGAIIDSAQLDIQTSAANANIVFTPNGTGNVNTGANLSVTGNIQGGNLRTAGLISATGNITGGNVLGGANVNATLFTGTTVSVTGNITGGNVF